MILNATPPDYSSVNDDIVWVAYDVNSTNAAYLNYKYVGEVWIAGVKVFTSKVFPRPNNNMGVFNFGTVIREYISAKLSPTTNGILAQELGQGKFAIDVQLLIKEEYNGTIGAVVLTDTTRTFYNHYNSKFSDFTTSGSFTYTFSFVLGYVNYVNTLRPLAMNLFLATDKYYLPYFSASAAAFNLVIAGQTKVITPTAAKTMQIFNISPAAINSEYPGLITAATTSYTVIVGGRTFTVNLICEQIYTIYMMHFLNKFGGFETMAFHKVSRPSIEIERKEWQQPAYRISSLGAVTLSENGVMHEQSSVFASKYKEKLKISTDFLSDAEYVWLSQLVASPLVYLQDSSTIYPVKITNTDYEVKQNINDKLTTLSIDIEFGKMIKTQFR